MRRTDGRKIWGAGRRALRRVVPAIASVLAVLISPCIAGGASRFLGGKIVITAEPVPTRSGYEDTGHGYAEYRLSITNHSKSGHKIRLSFPANAYSTSGHNIRQITRTVEVGPASTAIVSLPHPAVQINGSDILVHINDKKQKVNVPCDKIGHGQSDYPGDQIGSVLAGREVSENLRNTIGSVNLGGNNVQVYRSEAPVAQWSSNWTAYSRYDSVIMTGQEMQQAPPSVRQAVMRYVECGGSLFVENCGALKAPKNWLKAPNPPRNATMYHIGFGQCCMTDQRGYFPNQAKRMLERSYQPWSNVRGVDEANRIFPVIEDLKIPVRGLLILMIVFAVAIGPVNLMILGRKKKRIWMLWIVPAVSLLTCGTVFAYATFAEGWRGHRRTETLTILDQRTHRATTIGWTAFYSPLTPGDGLHFEYETELSPQIGFSWDDNAGSSRTIDWTKDQHFASGWVKARVPTHFKLRKSQTRRVRISLRRSEQLTAVNGLGAQIQRLYLADTDGKVYTASDIQPGAAATLTAGSIKPVGRNNTLREFYRSEWTGIVNDFDNRPGKYLRPGTYIAILDGTPFVEEGLAGATPRKCRSVVYGILDTDEESR